MIALIIHCSRLLFDFFRREPMNIDLFTKQFDTESSKCFVICLIMTENIVCSLLQTVQDQIETKPEKLVRVLHNIANYNWYY